MSTKKMFLYNKLDGTIPLSNLMFYQRFNNSVADQTGNYSVSSSGITYANGLYSGGTNESVVIDSPTDSIRINSTSDFSFGNGIADLPFSVSFIFNATNLGSLVGVFRIKVFISNRGTTDINSNVWTIISDDSTSPKIKIRLFDQSTGAIKDYICTTVLLNNMTYHVTCAYSPSKGCSVYINGSIQTVNEIITGTYVAMEKLSNNIRIGGATWDDGLILLGKLDGFGIWNVALNSKQAKLIYDKQASGLEIL